MGDFRAITAVSDAIVHLLESQYSPEDFGDTSLQFKVYLRHDFTYTNGRRCVGLLISHLPKRHPPHPPGRLGPDGRRQRPMLPIDMHLLLTAWAKHASLQHAIAGWMMRILEDTPSLPPGLLNHRYPGTFQPDETVEVCLTELTTEELFRIWEVIVNNAYQISVPYVARNVRIESMQGLSRVADAGAPWDYQKLIHP